MDETSFLSEIAKEASFQEEAILKKAEEASRAILEEARKEAERLEQTLVHRIDLEIRKKRSRAMTQASLEKRHELLQLKSRFVEETVEASRQEFNALKAHREYPEILKKFLSELAKSLGESSKKAVVRVSPDDEKSVRPLLHDLSFKAELRTDATLAGGVEIEDEENHLRMRNTFESRLKRAHEEVIQHLNQLLFQGIDV